MSHSVVVRYQTRPEAADENARLSSASIARSLSADRPDFSTPPIGSPTGFRSSTWPRNPALRTRCRPCPNSPSSSVNSVAG